MRELDQEYSITDVDAANRALDAWHEPPPRKVKP
jgi:hypothetical protein